jgi:hypothetical protein
MKPHIYTFKYLDSKGIRQYGEIEGNGSRNAFIAACADTRLKDCIIVLSSFRRKDTAKGANRAGGLDGNGKQLNARNYKDTKDTNWTDKTIQYPRLLAEIRAIGLTKEQYEFLNESMDLSQDEIDEVLEWAEEDWQTIKAHT